MSVVKVEVELKVETCCACGVPFGIPDYLMLSLRKSGNGFYCPNGHPLTYGPSEAERLQKELKRAKKDTELYRQWYDAEQDDHARTRRSLSATKGVLTKTKKRVSNGSCPCCNRHFTNLQRHMTTKHPDYAQDEVEGG